MLLDGIGKDLYIYEQINGKQRFMTKASNYIVLVNTYHGLGLHCHK